MKAKLIRILIAALLLAVAYGIERTGALPMWQLLLVYLVPYLVAGYDVVGEAIEGLTHGHPFDENFLMVVATLGALCIGFLPGGEPQLPEAVFVMLFFQVGELFESYAEGRSRRSIKSLMQIRPDTATVECGGRTLTVPAAEVKIGETMVVSAGERIALDGTVTEGTTSLNTVALTGESLPRDVGVGDEVYSGTINLQGLIKVRVSKTFGESTASRIIDLVEHASESKSKSEAFITKFARIYTPVVVGAAVLLALVPPLFAAGTYADALPTWLLRALIFLVVSCPCALVLSVPLSFFGGIGGASRRGILVKGGNYMETLARTGTVVFDKTGTLTRGRFSVTAVHPECVDEQRLLHLAAHVERFSTHPIAISLRNAYPNEADHCHVDDIEEIAGRGVRGQVNGHTVCVGNEQMMDDVGAAWHPCHEAGTIVHVSMDGEYLGHIVISDELKPDAARAVQELKALGVERTVMLTGDHEEVAADVAQRVGVDEYAARLLPADKVARVEKLLTEKPAGRTLAFVGDGINDAPVLARADVGIAMGGMGSDAAIEAADVVLMDDQPSKIPVAIRLARNTVLNARENVVFAIAVKLAILVLAAAGVAGMPLAVFGDVGVMVICVLNAARTLRA